MRIIVKSSYLRVDNSTIKALASEKKAKAHLGYQWVYRDPASGLVLVAYLKGRRAHDVMERLADFAGYLQTDGYRAYETYLRKHPQVTGMGGLAYICRKLFEARQQQPRLAEVALTAIGSIVGNNTIGHPRMIADNKSYSLIPKFIIFCPPRLRLEILKMELAKSTLGPTHQVEMLILSLSGLTLTVRRIFQR